MYSLPVAASTAPSTATGHHPATRPPTDYTTRAPAPDTRAHRRDDPNPRVADGDDLGTRTFSEPNWQVGDAVALRDRIYRVYRVVYLDDDSDVRGMLMLEEPPPT